MAAQLSTKGVKMQTMRIKDGFHRDYKEQPREKRLHGIPRGQQTKSSQSQLSFMHFLDQPLSTKNFQTITYMYVFYSVIFILE